MSPKVLIVEDEILVALNLQHQLSMMGYDTVGIAPDADTALALAQEKPDIALVDVNLRDGETGPQIGAKLANEFGTSVLFVTANPRSLQGGVPGAVGVVNKPYDEESIGAALAFLVSVRNGANACPPPNVRLFQS